MEAESTSRRATVWQALGPGIVYAGAAIGVSHLVQATRAGASYGFTLVWAVIIVNLFKYPFFELGHRYTAATGESLLAGYRRVGKWAVISFLLIAFFLGLPTVAAVTLVTSGLASQMVPVNFDAATWAALLLGFCCIVLAAGGYPWLDKVMKVMMVVLVLCTMVAVAAAVKRGPMGAADFVAPSVWNRDGIPFLIALMGWMPTPLDICVWTSLWMLARARQTGHAATLRGALFDFNLGYIATVVMALMFLSLGALVMFGTGESPAPTASAFAAQLVRMYTVALGEWSRPIIVTAAFIAMLSTTITVLDGFPRVTSEAFQTVWPATKRHGNALYWAIMIAGIGGTVLVFLYLTDRMRTLVDFVTTLAFLSAPLVAFINCRVIALGNMPADLAPPRWLRVLSWAGLVFLVGFSVLYLVSRIAYGH